MGSKTISNCLQIYGVVMLESSNFLEAISSITAKIEMGKIPNCKCELFFDI
jgi:hypothetical protein